MGKENPLEWRSFPRILSSTDTVALAATIDNEMKKANSGSFHLSESAGVIKVGQATWTGVSNSIVSKAIKDAPVFVEPPSLEDRLKAVETALGI